MEAAGHPAEELQLVRRHRSGLELALLAISRDYLALGGTVVTLLVVLVTILAPWLAPHDPNDADYDIGRLAPLFTPGHFLGTDSQARDILSRLVWGGRVSLPIAALPILLSSALGLLLGLVA